MCRVVLCILILLIFAPVSYGISDIQFSYEKGFILVAVSVNGNIPVTAVLSTGSQFSMFDPEIARRYKFKYSYTNDPSEMTIAGVEGKGIVFIDVPKVVVGDQAPINISMRDRRFKEMSSEVGREISMILGSDYFKGKVLQIDFRKSVLRVLEEFKVSSSANNSNTIVLTTDGDFQHSNGFISSQPVATNVMVNGQKIRTLIDTMRRTTIAFSPSAAKDAKLGALPPMGATSEFNLESLTLAKNHFGKMPAILVGKRGGFDEPLKDYGAILGMAILQNFTVTFDWKSRSITLER